jgi:hypothetical protein
MQDGGESTFESLPLSQCNHGKIPPCPPNLPSSLYHDDLSAFGSSIVFSRPECHSGTRFGGWLSLMKTSATLFYFV